MVLFVGGLSNTPDLKPMEEGDDEPDTPELWLLWGAKYRQTGSIGSDGDGWPLLESIGLFRKSVRERLSKYLSRYSSGCGGVQNVGKRTPSDVWFVVCDTVWF